MKRHYLIPLAVPFGLALLATSAQSDPKDAKLNCGMELPSVEIIKNFKGSNSEPFILKHDDEGAHSKEEITLLSMNIQNIPFANYQNPDYRKDRADCLTKFASQFDASALQEDFLPRKNTMSSSWKPVFNRTAIIKTGSPGLSFQSYSPFKKITAAPFTHNLCSGLFDKGSDCLATKGFQISEINGVKIINTHMDSGDAPSDALSRKAQLAELSKALPASGPLLIIGDYNFYYKLKEDEETLSSFLKINNLTLFARYSPEKGHDLVLGRGININWIGKVEQPLLSDHAGLVINLSLPAASQPIELSLR